MQTTGLAQIIKDGDEQIVLLPLGFELDCDEVMLIKQGEQVILQPLPRRIGSQGDHG